MTTVSEVTTWLEQFAPSRLAEPWDNVGLLWGDPAAALGDREAVLAGAVGAGAGQIAAYRECAFATPGEGTFFGTEASHPAVGQRGRRETVAELRLEFVCAAEQLAAVLAAIRARHSY